MEEMSVSGVEVTIVSAEVRVVGGSNAWVKLGLGGESSGVDLSGGDRDEGKNEDHLKFKKCFHKAYF